MQAIKFSEDAVYDVVHGSTDDFVDMVLYCTKCNAVYGLVPAGQMMFHSGKHVCDCGWNCCESARPVGKPHQEHMGYRPATSLELKTLTTYCPNCMGGKPHIRCKYCHGSGRVTLYGYRQWQHDGEPRYQHD